MNPKALESADWNFDAVPDRELVACCYWEYARESVFIRDVRQRCMSEQQATGERDEKLHKDLQRVQSIGHPAWMFLHGFFCPPDGVLPDAILLKPDKVHRLTGSFPKPWQLLTKEERAYRTYIPPRGVIDCQKFVPVTRGSGLDAKDILRTVTQQQRLAEAEREQVRREHSNWCEDARQQSGKLRHPDIRASVVYASGTEKTVIEINWGIFTNDEIVQAFRKWVKANRPQDVAKPDAKGRNKARDWRVALERLGMMRLLHQWALRELPNAAPVAWNLYRKREWYKERKRAGEMFRRLFPFLSKSDRPLNWPTQGGRSK
jgi:hypothetical protein